MRYDTYTTPIATSTRPRRLAAIAGLLGLLMGVGGCAQDTSPPQAADATASDSPTVDTTGLDEPATGDGTEDVETIEVTADPAALTAPDGAVAHYPLEESLESTVDGTPALTAIRDISVVEDDDASGNGAVEFADNGGLSLVVRDLVDPETYTIAMRFHLDGDPSGWAKIVDVSDRNHDTGLYAYGQNFQFNDYLVDGGDVPYGDDAYATFVLRRDAAGTLSWFVDGQEGAQVDDSEQGLGVLGASVSLFVDDLAADGGPEHTSGRVAWISVFDEALSDERVASLSDAPSPTAHGPAGDPPVGIR